MNQFSSEIVHYFDDKECVAEIYYRDLQWAQIFFKEQRLRIQFYPHPRQGAWELSFEDAVKTLKNAKDKMLHIPRTQPDLCIHK